MLGKYRLQILLLLAVCLACTPVALLAFIILIYVLGVLLPLGKSGSISRTIVSILVILASNTILAGIGWIANIPLRALSIVVTYCLLLLIILLRYPHLGQSSLRPVIKWPEIFASTLSLIVLLITIMPTVSNPSVTNLARIVSYGGDNLSHLELINAVVQNKGYTYAQYSSLGTQYSVIKPLIGYPQGYHFDAYFLNDSLKPVSNRPLGARRLLFFYEIYAALWFAVLCYLFVILCLQLISTLDRRLNYGYMVTAAATIWLFSWVFFTAYAAGFQTQIAALALILGAVYVLVEFQDQTKLSKRFVLALTAIIIGTSTAFIWLFPWPVIMAAIGFVLLKTLGIRKHKALYVTLALIAMLALIQIFVQIRFGTKKNSLNEQGSILLINNLGVWSLFGLAISFGLLRLSRSLVIKVLVWLSLAAALFSFSILIYQLVTVGEPRYYYYKSAYTVLMLSVILLVGFFSETLNSVAESSKTLKPGMAWLLSIVVSLSFVSLAWSQRTPEFQQYISRRPYGISVEMADAISSLAKKRPQTLPNVIAIGSCNRAQDIKAIQLTTALSGVSGYPDAISKAQFESPDKNYTFKSIRDYQSSTSDKIIIIISDPGLQNNLGNWLDPSKHNIEFIKLGDAVSGIEEPLAKCPDRLH